MLKKLLSILLIISILLPQKTYEFTEEEVQIFYSSIQELEFADSTNQKIIENLNEQIYIYIQSDSLCQSQIEDYKRQLEIKEDMIDLVKPKWYDNKYLWFGYGLALTSGSVILAGQLK